MVFPRAQSDTVMRAIDRARIFLCICPLKVLEIQVTDEIPEDAPQQNVPGWTSIISNRPSVPTNINYCQAIPSSPSDLIQFTQLLKEQKHCLEGLGRK